MSDTQNQEADELPLRRFWKSRRDLPTVVWDPVKNRAKFEFVRGVLDTRDPALANELIDMGYQEVELDEGENVKPPLEDLYQRPEPVPMKGRRVQIGHEHEPRFRPVNRKTANLDPTGATKLAAPKVVSPPKTVGG